MDVRAASPWGREGQAEGGAVLPGLGSDPPWVGQLGHCPYSSFLPNIIFQFRESLMTSQGPFQGPNLDNTS